MASSTPGRWRFSLLQRILVTCTEMKGRTKMSEVTVVARLPGAYSRLTGSLDGYDFVDGACIVRGEPEDVDKIVKYLSRMYQARADDGSWSREESPSETTLVLTGPLAGATVELNGYQFKNGECTITGSPEDLVGVRRYMRRSYQAYLKGSEALKHAEAKHVREDDEDPVEDGQSEVQAEPAPQEPVSEKAAPVVEERDGDEAGDPGLRAEGDGDDEAGPQDQKAQLLAVKEAVHSLDPDDESHWNNNGAPAVLAVRAVHGDDSVTRAEIDAAAPGYDREFAKALKKR